jgi:hypothetical protein
VVKSNVKGARRITTFICKTKSYEALETLDENQVSLEGQSFARQWKGCCVEPTSTLVRKTLPGPIRSSSLPLEYRLLEMCVLCLPSSQSSDSWLDTEPTLFVRHSPRPAELAVSASLRNPSRLPSPPLNVRHLHSLLPPILHASRPPSSSYELNWDACGPFCKLVCVSFGFGTRTDGSALSIGIASAYIHLAVNGFLQTIALEHSQLTDLLNVRGAVRGG